MKKIHKNISVMSYLRFVLLLVFLGSTSLFAQSFQSAKSPRLFLEPTKTIDWSQQIANGSQLDPLSALDSTDTVKVTLSMVLDSLDNIDSVLVDVGSTPNGKDVFSGGFEFDKTTGLSQGQAYIRRGQSLRLLLGSSLYHQHFYCRIRLKSVGGQLSPEVNYTH